MKYEKKSSRDKIIDDIDEFNKKDKSNESSKKVKRAS